MLSAHHLLRCPVVKSSTQAAQTVLLSGNNTRLKHPQVKLMAAKSDAGEEPWVLWCVSSHSCTLCGWHVDVCTQTRQAGYLGNHVTVHPLNLYPWWPVQVLAR